MTIPVRHILSLSGGKDSAALAIYMRDRIPEMEYIFHDTDKELPETYLYLDKLEAILGRKIVRTAAEHNFDKWLKVYGGMIPSKRHRWCTYVLKLKPFEEYIGDDPVLNYVGLRADEAREGYISTKPNIRTVYPFREDGLVKADIIRILQDHDLWPPPYTEWGRTRSGCFFCFFQQKIEWVRLKEVHPELFEEAKKYEFANKKNGNPFYWSENEPLEQLEKPERMEEIKRNHEKAMEKARRNAKARTLVQIFGESVEEEDEREACLICHL